MTEFFTYHNQKVAYNSESKIVKCTIIEPFNTAGDILNWQDHEPKGFGLNQKILNLVIKTKSTLIVFVESEGHDYFARWDKVEQFINNHNTGYKVKNNWLEVVPMDIFTEKMEMPKDV